MTAAKALPPVILAKLHEEVDRTEHLLALIPPDQLDWRPEWPTPQPSYGLTISRLLGHLLTCLAGFCAALHAAHGDRLAHFTRLRELPVATDPFRELSQPREPNAVATHPGGARDKLLPVEHASIVAFRVEKR